MVRQQLKLFYVEIVGALAPLVQSLVDKFKSLTNFLSLFPRASIII